MIFISNFAQANEAMSFTEFHKIKLSKRLSKKTIVNDHNSQFIDEQLFVGELIV